MAVKTESEELVTFEQAVKSGSKFRHENWTSWYTLDTLGQSGIPKDTILKCILEKKWLILVRNNYTASHVIKALNICTDLKPNEITEVMTYLRNN